MKELILKELFNVYTDVRFTDEIDMEARLAPTVSTTELHKNSLLFITEKVGADDGTLDASSLPCAPYAIVASETKKIELAPCPIIRVKSVRTALSYALSIAYDIDYDRIKVIGITGTNGKTTTATLIYEILRRCGYKAGFIGTGKIISDGVLLSDELYSMTTPDPTVLYPAIAKIINDGCSYLVMEVSSHSIALGKVAPIRFEYAIFTNLDDDHLDFHCNKDDYFRTKLKLFVSAKRGLFNLDDEYSRKAATLAQCERSTFGIINEGDAYATEVSIKELSKTTFFYRSKNLIFKVNSRLSGAFNVYNTLAAIKSVIDLGIKPCVAKKAIEDIDGIEGRMEIIDGNVKSVIDYAHTPAAFYNCLKTLKQSVKNEQKLIIVFGCGGDRDKFKRPLFGRYADAFADKIIITEDNCRSEAFDSIVKDIVAGIDKKEFDVIPDREKAIRHAFKCALPGDIVAVIGKGHEKYKITGGVYTAFDERKIIKEAMKETQVGHVCG